MNCDCICHEGEYADDCLALCDGCFKTDGEINSLKEKGGDE